MLSLGSEGEAAARWWERAGSGAALKPSRAAANDEWACPGLAPGGVRNRALERARIAPGCSGDIAGADFALRSSRRRKPLGTRYISPVGALGR
jgi:hypothetical protein